MVQIKKIFLFIFLSIFFSLHSFSQDSSMVVSWVSSVTKLKDSQFEIKLNGAIQKGWHLYKSDVTDGLSGLTITFFDSSIQSNPVILKSPFKSYKDQIFENRQKEIIENKIELIQSFIISDKSESSIKIKLNYELGAADNFITEEKVINIVLSQQSGKSNLARLYIPSININQPKNDCGIKQPLETNSKSKSLLNLFLIGFLGGLVALLTPCVFPMIPLTVSFFTKKATSKKAGISNAFLYGLFIFIIYILLSLPFHFLDTINPEFLNNISTNVYLNILFFIVFVIFAFSFFGFYEITLPSKFSTGADSKAGSGNILGIFFMALTLALVSFSCTGPILGSLLAGSLVSDGGAMQLTAGMGGFGLALALPFALFAMFPHWLQSLPKSGGWLNTVKVTLGFLELALAFKFLSNADLVKHWGLLKREIFILLWILIGIGLSLYLFGLLKFAKDSQKLQLSNGRKIFATIVALFTIYLIPGVTNTSWANLKLISGFPPPLYYSIYEKESDCVLGLHCTKDYEEALEMSKAENKPILLDFTGYACVNCRRTEENIWSDPDVFKLMNEKFIVVSLYVDDKKLLPSSKQFIFTSKEGIKKEINTVGDQWATFETENFANNAQPLYAIINNKEELLNHPVGYTPDRKDYLKWLQCGVETYYRK